jgi:hypothetical protein
MPHALKFARVVADNGACYSNLHHSYSKHTPDAPMMNNATNLYLLCMESPKVPYVQFGGNSRMGLVLLLFA